DAIVDAVAQTIGDVPVSGGATFEDDEIKDFLNSMVPFYDDLRLPTVSRKIAELLGLVVNPDDTRAVAVLDQLSTISPRIGYRVAQRALGAVRPLLSYDQLDKLSKVLLGLFSEGGDAHDEFVAFLKATALELADDAEPRTDGPDNTTLHLVLDLLLTEDPALAEGSDKLWTVRRDQRGFAQAVSGAPFVDADADGLADLDDQNRFVVEGGGADRSPWPFARARGADPVAERNADGLAVNDLGQPMFTYFDANATVLASLMREAKPLIERTQSGQPSTVENASRGLRPLLGPSAARSYEFKQPFAFQGPDLSKSPMLDLLHAFSMLLKQPETRSALELVKELMKQDANESVAAGPIFAGLRIDERADDPKHAKAFITGFDGKQGSAHEFWDDMIAMGARLVKRPAMAEALIRAFSNPLSSMQGQLYANWMKYNDVVKYKNAPFEADMTTGKFTEQQFADLNASLADTVYSSLVDRNAPDTGMNRSIWQRTMSLLHTINGSKMCNKEGASLSINDPLPLSFPIGGTYKRCDFVEIADPGQAYSQSLLGTLKIKLKDQGLNDIAALGSAIGLVGSTSEIQEKESQIVGFAAVPTGPAIARFMFGPSNKFMYELFGDVLTNDGVPLKKYEPYALFPMEVLDKTAVVDGQPQSFISNGLPLLKAFEDNELLDAEGNLVDGYMFGHLLNTFHMHWTRPKAELCPEAVIEGVSEGCTQSLDVTKKFWSYQGNVVSYEPLIIEAFIDEKLTQVLQKSAAQLANIKIGDKDGIAVLGDFVKMMLRPNDLTAAPEGQLRYRDGRRWATTNTCVVPANANGTTPPEKCSCPAGAVEEGDNCKIGNRIVPRGKIVGASPLYLLLDALKGFDRAFEGENEERHQAWLAARSELVDRFLGAEPVAGKDLTYRFKNPRSRKLAVKALEWAVARIDSHQTDLSAWSDGLTARAEKVLSHPMVARGLDVLDAFWKDSAAGDEFAAVSAYLMDADKHPDAFAGIIVAVADTLTFLDRDPNLTPLVQFASLAVAPNAFSALDSGGDPDVDNGTALKTLELTKDIVNLHEGDGASALSKLLKNLVLANQNGESPLEVLFDSIAEVNRDDPSMESDFPMAPSDASGSLGRVQSFLLDEERGLERIYRVIQSRNLNVKLPETP
ncbi:MAG TPA: hypothetical protein VFX59_25255, partial [Polyangiales bacterium]|nr:hypothetical protein [Polyangiales bacterium]